MVEAQVGLGLEDPVEDVEEEMVPENPMYTHVNCVQARRSIAIYQSFAQIILLQRQKDKNLKTITYAQHAHNPGTQAFRAR